MAIKGLLLASAAITSLPIGIASAADLPARMPAKAPVVVAPPFTWTGFYVGGNLGAVWARSEFRETDPGPLGFADTSTYVGVIGGVQAGYNWQISNIVLGAEADFDASSATKSVVLLPQGGVETHDMRLSWLATARGRGGLAFDRFLPYVTGGVAFAHLRNEFTDTGLISQTIGRNGTATGWTVGGGVEYAFDRRWSAKAEYLYAKFPDVNVTTVSGPYTFNFRDSLSIARVGVNYRF
jgi:outer membrane immunogenic protein